MCRCGAYSVNEYNFALYYRLYLSILILIGNHLITGITFNNKNLNLCFFKCVKQWACNATIIILSYIYYYYYYYYIHCIQTMVYKYYFISEGKVVVYNPPNIHD